MRLMLRFATSGGMQVVEREKAVELADGDIAQCQGDGGLRHGACSLSRLLESLMTRSTRSHEAAGRLETSDKPGGLLSLAGVVSVALPAKTQFRRIRRN